SAGVLPRPSRFFPQDRHIRPDAPLPLRITQLRSLTISCAGRICSWLLGGAIAGPSVSASSPSESGAGETTMAAHPAQAHRRSRDPRPVVDPHGLESALRAAVAERLGEPKFGLWFGAGVRLGLSGDGQALEVRVPNAFFGEWIRGHFSGSLADAARAVTGRSLRLDFAIRDEAEPPLGDVVGPGEDGLRPPVPVVTVPLPGNPKAPRSSPPS